MTPRSMSRTTLITNSFIFPPPTRFPFSFTLAYPSHLQYASFRYFELCRISVCTDVCLDFSLSEKLEADYRRSTHYSKPLPLPGPPGRRVVSGRPGASPGSTLSLRNTLMCHSLEGNNQVPWRQAITLCLNCLVSCKINTLLYIFREQQQQKNAAIGFKIFIQNTFPKTNYPKGAF